MSSFLFFPNLFSLKNFQIDAAYLIFIIIFHFRLCYETKLQPIFSCRLILMIRSYFPIDRGRIISKEKLYYKMSCSKDLERFSCSKDFLSKSLVVAMNFINQGNSIVSQSLKFRPKGTKH